MIPSVNVSNVLTQEKKDQVIALGRLGWSLQRIQPTSGAGWLRKAHHAATANNSPGTFPVVESGTNYPAGAFFSGGEYVDDPSVRPAFRYAKPGDVIEPYPG